MARTFASDNNSGVHPEVLNAIASANIGHVHAYGDDPWTAGAVDALRRHLGPAAEVFFLLTGTGANVTALSAMSGPGHAVVCPATAHIATDECGAPEHFTGAKIIGVETPEGKLSPGDIAPLLAVIGNEHHSQPRVVSISQVAETGVVYTPDEVRALADLCHERGLLLHMDGARIANAAASLGVPIAAFTSEAGVDAVSFGGTKNGLMLGEAVVLLDPRLAEAFKYIRKSSAQLASKMRFISAQFQALYGSDLWLELATNANAMATRLAQGAREAGLELVWPVQANEVFARLPVAAVPTLQRVADFYVWEETGDGTCVVRWVTSWDSEPEDVDRFVDALSGALGEA